MHLGLRGKVAVVTGASRGIGKAVAQALLQEGCSVAICSRNAERLEMTVSELSETGPVFGVPTDVTDERAVQRFIDAVLKLPCDDSSRNPLTILHCCNTWPVIAKQTLLEMCSSLVIRITRDQD